MDNQVIIRLPEVNSTNNYLKEHKELWDNNFTVVITEKQTAGRGRYQRFWYSGTSDNLTFSYIFKPSEVVSNINTITILVGLGIMRCLKKYVGGSIHMKWPNDIYYENQKLAGILCEQIIRENKSIVIVGIGLNVNTSEFPDEIEDKATSISIITGEKFDLDNLFEEINQSQIEALRQYDSRLSETVIRELKNVTRTIGKRVSFVIDDQQKKGEIVDIEQSGALRIREDSGYEYLISSEIMYENCFT